MPTGISTADTYGLGQTTGGGGDAYVNESTRSELVGTHFLIDSASGNLTLRATGAEMPPSEIDLRMTAGVDLADDTDVRTRATGCHLIAAALRAVQASRPEHA